MERYSCEASRERLEAVTKVHANKQIKPGSIDRS